MATSAWLANTTNRDYGLQDPNRPVPRSQPVDLRHSAAAEIELHLRLPFGRGRAFFNKMPRPLELILGGWKTAGVWTIHDGFPLAFTVGEWRNSHMDLWPTAAKSDRYAGTQRWTRIELDQQLFRQSGRLPDAGPVHAGQCSADGTAACAVPFFFTANLSVAKEFSLSSSHEDLKLELRLEAENAFNHPVFGTPDTIVGDPSFGVDQLYRGWSAASVSWR